LLNFDFFNSSDDSDTGLEISDLMTTLVAVFILAYAVIKQGEWNSLEDKMNGMDSIIEKGFPAIKSSKYITHLGGGVISATGFFKDSSTDLSDKDKQELMPVCSRILDVVNEHSRNIKYVIFKGHASSSVEKSNKHRQYFINQWYSEQRATNTMEYCLGGDFDQKYPNLIGKFMSVGFSYSQPLSSSKAGSARRVEIELVPYE
jgi:hypothetical protein